MRVLVCGGRMFDKPKVIGRTLAAIHVQTPITLVITGGANGADRLGGDWAENNRIPLCVFPANWRFEGKAAGPKRNGRMLQFAKPDLVVAFEGGPGTDNMVAQAEAAGVPVIRPQNIPQPPENARQTPRIVGV